MGRSVSEVQRNQRHKKPNLIETTFETCRLFLRRVLPYLGSKETLQTIANQRQIAESERENKVKSDRAINYFVRAPFCTCPSRESGPAPAPAPSRRQFQQVAKCHGTSEKLKSFCAARETKQAKEKQRTEAGMRCRKAEWAERCRCHFACNLRQVKNESRN